jgi:hypothetical protein
LIRRIVGNPGTRFPWPSGARNGRADDIWAEQREQAALAADAYTPQSVGKDPSLELAGSNQLVN